jgi:diguanylate cyclase (GGDEF)-like protein
MLRSLVARVRRDPFDAIVLAAAVAGIAVGTAYVNRVTIESVLHRDAERAAGGMSQFLATSLPELPSIMSGRKISPSGRDILELGRIAANAERYEIYNSAGGRVLEYGPSAAQDEGDEHEHENLRDHKPQAFRNILSGDSYVESFEKQENGKTVFLSEGYAPIKDGGRIAGVLEVYLDQTAKKADFESALVTSSMAALSILLLGLTVPVWLYRRRLREKKVVEDRVKYLTQYDELTGLVNRGSLQEYLVTALDGLGKEEGARAALLLIDVDRFEAINDGHGHKGGDAVLRCIGERLSLIVGSSGYVSRFGGDEFAVLMPAVSDRSSLEIFAAQLIASMAQPYPVLERGVVAPVSIGISLMPDDAASADLALRHADLALHAAKMAGRNGYRLYDPSLEQQYARKLAVERAVRRACASNGFELYYQPQFALSAQVLIGFEALLRLNDPELGRVPPSEFIPFTEEMGLIPQIGEWVLREACRFAVLWPAPLGIAVNLSPLQFRDGGLPRLVALILAESKLPPQRLELEVTEGLILANTEAVMDQIRAIRALGVSFAMDDFGTKYSSLSYLWNFTFDSLKIDRDFVQGLGSAEKAAQILETIITLGKTLDVRITAEGVESAEQAQFLAEHHCDAVQGYFFGRPMPAIDVPAAIVKDFQQRNMRERDAIAAEPALQVA